MHACASLTDPLLLRNTPLQTMNLEARICGSFYTNCTHTHTYIHSYIRTYIVHVHTYIRTCTYENTYALNSKVHILREVVTEGTVAAIRHKPKNCVYWGVLLRTPAKQLQPQPFTYVCTYVPLTILCTSLGVEHMIQPSRSRFMRIPVSWLWHQSKCVGPSSLEAVLGILLGLALDYWQSKTLCNMEYVRMYIYVLAVEMRRIFPWMRKLWPSVLQKVTSQHVYSHWLFWIISDI